MSLLLLFACVEDLPPPDSKAPVTDTAGPEEDTAETGAPPPIDGDGDGALADVDCDDADAARFPGAVDLCDGIDQDCDGDPVGEGACGELVVLDEASAVGWWEGSSDGGTLALPYEGAGALGRAADLDQDGISDVIANQVATVVVRGRLPAPATPVGDDTIARGHSRLQVAGDFDGDGVTDAFVVSPGGTYERGHVYLLRGPADAWPDPSASIEDVAAGGWTLRVNNIYESLGSFEGAADLTGDGLSDVVLLSSLNDEYRPDDPDGYLRIVPGRTSALPSEGVLDDEEPWFGLDFGDGHTPSLLPDIDGDGVEDLMLAAYASDGAERRDTLAMVPSEIYAPTYSGQSLGDLWDTVPNGDVVRRYEPIQDRVGLGDADGDGYGDVAVALYDATATEDTLCTAVLHGAADLPARTLSDRIGGRVCDTSSSRNPAQRVVPDTDGDGVPDLFYDYVPELPYDADVGWKWSACVLPTAQLPASGSVAFDEARALCFGSHDVVYHASDVVDLDGDGLPELLSSDTTWGGGVGRILVLAGFAIPWDDPTRW